MASKHYHVIVNTPGYLPDSDPIVCATRTEAKQAAQWAKRDILDSLDAYTVRGSAQSGQIYITDNSREHDLGTVIEIVPCTESECDEYNGA